MTKHVYLLTFLTLVNGTWCAAQNGADFPEDHIRHETRYLASSPVPGGIVRTLKQDRKGNIWVAAFGGVYRYDGASFTPMTAHLAPTRFFSVLEDKKGDFWFGSVGSGVYHYDGKSFRQFTKAEGLGGDEVTGIYEDKKGDIWMATQHGASRYNGKSFQNYRINEAPKSNDDHDDNAVSVIIEDRNGKFWFGTKGRAYVSDTRPKGHALALKLLTDEGKPFWNIRSIIEDKKGNIWLGGEQGLWRYDGLTFTKITGNFVGHIIEDKKGNIWTSSQLANSQGYARSWGLSRYDEKTLADEKPGVTEIRSGRENIEKMTFGILEAKDGAIWFGALDGVYRYDGKVITEFKSKEDLR